MESGPTSLQGRHVRARLLEWLEQHPLLGFFLMAFIFAWLSWLPLIIASNGLGLVGVRLPVDPFFALGTFAGPALAAVLMTSLTTGRAGVNALLRRYLVWRVGWPWYLIALFGVPAGFLAASSLALGRIPIQTIIEQWQELLAMLPLVLISGLIIGALGEELGWRGFALPRLQRRFGPLWASLILGVLWAGWHVPLFTLAEWKGSIAVPTLAMVYFSWVVPLSVIVTWVYNNARGSLLIITLFHGALNATVGLVALGLLVVPDTLYFQAILYGVVALALIAITRGTLSYDGEEAVRDLPERPPAPEVARRGRRLGWVAVGAVVVLVSLWAVANVIYAFAGL